jgi:copper resistance protein B
MSARTAFNANRSRLPVAIIGMALAVPVMAQDPRGTQDISSMRDMQRMNMPGMQMPGKKPERPKKQGPTKGGSKPSMPGMKPMPMQSSQSAEMQHLDFGAMIGTRPKPGGLASSAQGMSSMRDMDMSTMQGGSPPASARSADYSDGYRSGLMRGMDMPDDGFRGMVILDQLEYAYGAHGNAKFIDGQAWYGTNFEKLGIKAEGEVNRGRLSDLRTEALWDHAITSYWGTQLGVRRDLGVGPDRTWAAIGVQGLAPFWFDTEATLYVGESGRTAARLQLECEEPLTQRLILQPKVEMNLYGRDDPLRAIDEGLSDAQFGLRLRYEIRRELAPYIGIVYRQRYGHAADFARAQGEHADDLQWVAGVHVWF